MTKEEIEKIETSTYFSWFHAGKAALLPIIWSIIILLSIIIRAWFSKRNSKFLESLPESVIEIIVGFIVGGILQIDDVGRGETVDAVLDFSSDTFMLFILPPIIFAEGFHTNTRIFFANINTILLHAIIGTMLNTFFTGWIMWHIGNAVLGDEVNFRLADAFLFGSFISAVDPVAVLAVFEKEHVDATIHGVVAGESTLNDGLSLVLFKLFTAVVYSESQAHDQYDGDYGAVVLWFLYRFIYVFGLGVVLGVMCGVLVRTGGCIWDSFPKFHVDGSTLHYNIYLYNPARSMSIFLQAPITLIYVEDSYRVLQPIILLCWSITAYALAEFIHASGIIAIMCYGMMAKEYSVRILNLAEREAFENVVSAAAHVAEATVFVILGIQCTNMIDFRFDGSPTGTWEFIFAAYFVTVCSRFLFTHLIGVTDNHIFREHRNSVQIELKDYFVMAFGGLRGAIAFSLAWGLYKENNDVFALNHPDGKDSTVKLACWDNMNTEPLHGKNNPIPIFEFGELFLQTTLVLVILTVFIQGTATPYLLNCLKTRREESHCDTHLVMMTNLMTPILSDGINHITHDSHGIIRRFRFQNVFHWLVENVEKMIPKNHQSKSHVVLMKEAAAEAHDDYAGTSFNRLFEKYWRIYDNAKDLGLVEGTAAFEYYVADEMHGALVQEVDLFSKVDHVIKAEGSKDSTVEDAPKMRRRTRAFGLTLPVCFPMAFA